MKIWDTSDQHLGDWGSWANYLLELGPKSGVECAFRYVWNIPNIRYDTYLFTHSCMWCSIWKWSVSSLYCKLIQIGSQDLVRSNCETQILHVSRKNFNSKWCEHWNEVFWFWIQGPMEPWLKDLRLGILKPVVILWTQYGCWVI